MKSYIAIIICRFMGHRWGRMQRINATEGRRICSRCSSMELLPMKTPYSRKRDAQANG